MCKLELFFFEIMQQHKFVWILIFRYYFFFMHLFVGFESCSRFQIPCLGLPSLPFLFIYLWWGLHEVSQINTTKNTPDIGSSFVLKHVTQRIIIKLYGNELAQCFNLVQFLYWSKLQGKKLIRSSLRNIIHKILGT